MKSVVALLKQDGSVEYIEFEYEKEITLLGIEKIIQNKGDILEIIEESFIFNKNYVIVGYKSGDKFNKHDINNYNVKGDAVFITLVGDEYTDTTELDVKKCFESYELISSSEEEELDSYDFTDGFLINDLY
tara:strand:- start:1525 stop:1917 length:393 start_codon:yes stop_codon:yes gene_type:complete